MVQWWRICLPIQETWIRPLIREDPTCLRATKPMHHNYWACSLEPGSHSSWAHMPQLRKPGCLGARAPQEKPLQWGARAPQLESSPCSWQLEKSKKATKTQSSQKYNKWIVKITFFKIPVHRTPWAVQWLRLCASIAGVMCLIPGQGTNILHARQCSQKLIKKKKKLCPDYTVSKIIYSNVRPETPEKMVRIYFSREADETSAGIGWC